MPPFTAPILVAEPSARLLAMLRINLSAKLMAGLVQREHIYEGMRKYGVPEERVLAALKAANSSNSAFASFRSRVSNPSVNQP
jgi:hypothetical protein